MVEVAVAKLGIDSATQGYVVVLQERGGDRLLPIWIGQAEAESIVMHMHGIKRQRPLTHDLCRSIILELGASLARVQITRVEQNTYFAELVLAHEGRTMTVDARPSDSIAIAIRLQAPIYADDSLLASMDVEESSEFGESEEEGYTSGEATPDRPGAEPGELSPEQLKRYLENLRPEDFGKFNP